MEDTLKDHVNTVVVVFCYLLKKGKVLLIERAGEPYAGDQTIVGGKKEPGESLFAAMKREVFEETGLQVGHAQLRGLFTNQDTENNYDVLTAYFVCDDFSGEIKESSEGSLTWVRLDDSFRLPLINPYYTLITPHVIKSPAVVFGAIRSEKGKNPSLQLD